MRRESRARLRKTVCGMRIVCAALNGHSKLMLRVAERQL